MLNSYKLFFLFGHRFLQTIYGSLDKIFRKRIAYLDGGSENCNRDIFFF